MISGGFGQRGRRSQSGRTGRRRASNQVNANEDEELSYEKVLSLVGFAAVALLSAVAWWQGDIFSSKFKQIGNGSPKTEKIAFKTKQSGNYSAAGAIARLTGVASLNYATSKLEDPDQLKDSPAQFIKSHNYDVFVKATKLFTMANVCKDSPAIAISVAAMRVSSGRSARNIAKLGRIIERDRKQNPIAVDLTESECKEKVPSLVNELMAMI